MRCPRCRRPIPQQYARCPFCGYYEENKRGYGWVVWVVIIIVMIILMFVFGALATSNYKSELTVFATGSLVVGGQGVNPLADRHGYDISGEVS